MSKRAVKLCVRRIALLCAGTGTGGLGLFHTTAAVLSPVCAPIHPAIDTRDARRGEWASDLR